MRNNKNIFLGLVILVVIIVASGWVYIPYVNKSKTQNNTAQEISPTIPTVGTVTPPCPVMPTPDGSMVPVCAPTLVMFPPGMENIRVEEINPTSIVNLNRNIPAILSSGTGTTTMKKATPWNDILIAETGSPYATLRNARYTMWPYPGEIALKEVYIILPDTYDPIFPGYSDKQFIESMDGTKHVMIYLRHKESTDIGADAKIFVQSPIATNEDARPDGRLVLFESNNRETYFSKIANGKEVIVEVSFTTPSNISPELSAVARKELLHAVENMEIIW